MHGGHSHICVIVLTAHSPITYMSHMYRSTSFIMHLLYHSFFVLKATFACTLHITHMLLEPSLLKALLHSFMLQIESALALYMPSVLSLYLQYYSIV